MSFKRLFASCFVSVVLLFSVASTGSVATANVVGGQLFGASGVDVGDYLYDVEFVNGARVSICLLVAIRDPSVGVG